MWVNEIHKQHCISGCKTTLKHRTQLEYWLTLRLTSTVDTTCLLFNYSTQNLCTKTFNSTDICYKLIINHLSSVLWCCWLGSRKGIRPIKTEWWGTGVVICLQRGANDLHMVHLMPLPPHHLLLQQNPECLPFWCRLAHVVREKKVVKWMQQLIINHCCTKWPSTNTTTHLHKQSWFSAELRHRCRSTVAAHRLAISWKLQSEILVPHAMDGIHACCVELFAAQLFAVDRQNVHLLRQHNECCLRCLANLFICTFLLPSNITRASS